MNINETLELDYLVEEITNDVVKVSSEPTSGASSIDYIATETSVFNPSETGTYKLNINGQTVEIEVVDIPDSGDYLDFSEFTPTLPYTYDLDTGTISFSTTTTGYSSQTALEVDQDGADSSSSLFAVSRTVDVTEAVTLECVTEYQYGNEFDELQIFLGGTTLLDTYNEHSWTERSFDISDMSGDAALEIGHGVSANQSQNPTSRITDLRFQ